MSDTIYALSSGAPPAAIAVVRISGPRADAAVMALAGRLPEPRRAALVTLRSAGEELDRALAIRFPGPDSATGEDIAELHLHGGRAVVAAVLAALGAIDGLREAEPGEFTRRAFEKGRIDLAEAEGLADLLVAETQAQRRAAQALAGGLLSRQVEAWRGQVLALSAAAEAALDFSDEGDVEEETGARIADTATALEQEISAALSRPPAERLRDGVRVAIAGPPNAGKSTLLNALTQRDAAIISPLAGTTRDLIEAPVAISGVPIVLIDMAGLRESEDTIEQIGVARARDAIGAADLILWLGPPEGAPEGSVRVQAKADIATSRQDCDLAVSAVTGAGLPELARLIVDRSRLLLPGPDEVRLNTRHRVELCECVAALGEVRSNADLLIVAEALRRARLALDRIAGRAGGEDMLDTLFGRFCIGK